MSETTCYIVKVKGTSDNDNKNWATASENRPTISLPKSVIIS